jgi:Ca2+-binding EF-hand superfamily protein
MRRSSFRFLSVLLALAVSPAFGDPAPPTQDPKTAFAQTDENGDGRIDREEFQHRVVEIFYFGDRDKDGYLTHEELVAAVAFPDDFAHADRNGDGRISLYEFIQVRFASFDKVDKDGDGLLSLDEVIATYESKK